MDAPGHFIAGGRLGPELKLSELIVPAVVVNIAHRAARDPDTVTVDDLRAFERRHGRIPRDSAVLMDSGWAAKVGDVAAYRGADAEGVLHFPGSGPRPPSGCCAAGGSVPWALTPSASTRASRRRSTPT